jgi:hypothetical protein
MPVPLLIQESQNQNPELRLRNALTISVFVILPSQAKCRRFRASRCMNNGSCIALGNRLFYTLHAGDRRIPLSLRRWERGVPFLGLSSAKSSLEPRKEIVGRWITLCNRGEIVGYVRVFLAAMRALKSKPAFGPRWQREYRRSVTKSDVMDQNKTATLCCLAACRPINMLRHDTRAPKKHQEFESST